MSAYPRVRKLRRIPRISSPELFPTPRRFCRLELSAAVTALADWRTEGGASGVRPERLWGRLDSRLLGDDALDVPLEAGWHPDKCPSEVVQEVYGLLLALIEIRTVVY
jgi:hypothetical protein